MGKVTRNFSSLRLSLITNWRLCVGHRAKILVTEEGTYDLSCYGWDDDRFSHILMQDKCINADQALDVSKYLREEISKMELHTITIPVIEKIVEAKLLEFGLTKPPLIRLDKCHCGTKIINSWRLWTVYSMYNLER